MKKDRKNIILKSLASMLEERNLSKITTAALAEKSKITEAALYRGNAKQNGCRLWLALCPAPRLDGPG